MKQWTIRMLINICCKQALKYNQRLEMLLSQEGVKYIYAVGCNACSRDMWLERVEKLQKLRQTK